MTNSIAFQPSIDQDARHIGLALATPSLVLSAVASASSAEIQLQRNLLPLADRRRFFRFNTRNELLCISDYYAGQILDISTTGMAFQFFNLNLTSKKVSSMPRPLQSKKMSILHAGPLSFFIMKNLLVKELHDRKTGLLYPGNADIVTYRRGVSFAVPLAKREFNVLQPYLAMD